MNKSTVIKLVGAAAPIVLGILGYLYTDVTPVVRDICGALLPFGSVVPTAVISAEPKDAGAR
jgi:hypothetical protein